MPRFIDETGNKYGHWNVIKKVDNPKKNGALFLCRCDCGKEQLILGKRLRAKETTQCTECQAKAHIKEYTGYKFNMLTVLDEYESRNGRIYWHCKCDCGNDTWVSAGNLTSGQVKSCGCLSNRCNRSLEDLTGQTFGNLTVLKLDSTINNRRMWSCQCLCGNKTLVSTTDLHTGKVKSCGCLKYLQIAPGAKYGKLTVLEATNERSSNGNIIYLCKCDCGNLHKVASSRLKNGTIKSCGCGRNISYNEENIQQLLEKNNIKFEREKSFSDLTNIYNSNKGRALSFDFYILDIQPYIIEFDGIQHFKIQPGTWSTQEKIDSTHQRDLLKNQYCFDHHIPLIRIPYDAEYEFKDLKLETTNFLLTPENENLYYLNGDF